MDEQLSLKDKVRIRMKSQHELTAGKILGIVIVLLLALSITIGLSYSQLPQDLRVEEKVLLEDPLTAEAVASSTLPTELQINFYGGLSMDSGLRRYLNDTDFKRYFSQLMPLLSTADLNIVNLDSPLDLSQRSPEAFFTTDLEALRSLNFQLFPLANSNFCADKGAAADLQLGELNNLPIDFIGFGESTNAAARAKRYPFGESGLSIFSTSAFGRNQRASHFESGMSIATDIQVFDRVTRAKINGDFVVVMLHWGNLHNSNIGSYQRELAQRYIDAGADLIIGASPGPAAGIEAYKQSLICYNLGSLQQSAGDGLIQPGFALELQLSELEEPSLHFKLLTQNLGLPTFTESERRLDIIKAEVLEQLENFSTAQADDGSFTIKYMRNEGEIKHE
ncbi:MAG: CapA family protein [Eubacteriales bacterium]|nr:CapA family protein [Eubacteriales bacterium]